MRPYFAGLAFLLAVGCVAPVAASAQADTLCPSIQCTLQGRSPGVAVRMGGTEAIPDTAPRFAVTIDAVSRAAGLPLLREPGGLGTARREARLWTGFGLGGPNRMLRVAETAAGAEGTLLVWWEGVEPRGRTSSAADRAKALQFIAPLRAELAAVGCSVLRTTARVESCEFASAASFDWDALLTRLDSIDPWTLVDESMLSRGRRIGIDGVTLVVELRDARGYRSYSYWTPRLDSEYPEIRRAAALMALTPQPREPASSNR